MDSEESIKNIEPESIEKCTCDGPWGREGCPVHGRNYRDNSKNSYYDCWQIDESEFIIN